MEAHFPAFWILDQFLLLVKDRLFSFNVMMSTPLSKGFPVFISSFSTLLVTASKEAELLPNLGNLSPDAQGTSIKNPSSVLLSRLKLKILSKFYNGIVQINGIVRALDRDETGKHAIVNQFSYCAFDNWLGGKRQSYCKSHTNMPKNCAIHCRLDGPQFLCGSCFWF